MFRQAMQANGPASGGDAGASNFNPSNEPSEDLDDRVTCQWCSRKFNEDVAKRHMPHCETKHKANAMKSGPPKRGT